MNIFEEIKSRLDIRDVYTYYTGRHIERHNKALCVFHNDTHPSMSFKGEIFKCFVCDKGGDVFKFMEYYLGLKGIEAAKRLNEDFRLGLIRTGRYDRRRELLERKRRAELERQKKLAAIEQQKNKERLEKIHKLQEDIALFKKILDDSSLQGVHDWARSELAEKEAKLDEVFSVWERENREYLYEMLDIKKRLSEYYEEERRCLAEEEKRLQRLRARWSK